MDLLSLDFPDLTPTEIPVKLAGKDYILREAGAGIVAQWKSYQTKQARMEDGKLTMGEIGDSDLFLLSLCLFPKDDVEPVKLATLKTWKNAVTQKLYEKLKEMSGLADETLDQLKKRMVKDAEKVKKLEEAAAAKNG